MTKIYLSPHPDDIALSCGGLVWQQAQAGEQPQIWTLCAGDPPRGRLSPFALELHRRWGVGREAAKRRREEDARSCARLGAVRRHFSVPDCIYRRSPIDGRPLYDSEEKIFSPLHPHELALVEAVSAELGASLPDEATLVCPLAIGGHVDHRLARMAAEKLGQQLWYYADYPYVERVGREEEVTRLIPPGYEKSLFGLSREAMKAWFESVAEHRSQISTFWADTAAMERDLEDYYRKNGGIPLWTLSKDSG
jgi:LmbE family N-acetylglucosaminyl deacetylase